MFGVFLHFLVQCEGPVKYVVEWKFNYAIKDFILTSFNCELTTDKKCLVMSFFQTHLIVDNIFEHNGISNLVNKFRDVEARETLFFTIIILYTVRNTDIHLQNLNKMLNYRMQNCKNNSCFYLRKIARTLYFI